MSTDANSAETRRPEPSMRVAGLLLAAGGGRRMGRPKALLADAGDVPWLDRAVGVLFAGGCSAVTVVLGAEADRARGVLEGNGWAQDPDVTTVVAADWAQGLSASLRAGLRSLSASPYTAAVVHLVDLRDVGEAGVARLVALAAPDALARATYDGRPGHPVLLGRAHWASLLETVRGDSGAREYLDRHGVLAVPCEDLGTGLDVDRPDDQADANR